MALSDNLDNKGGRLSFEEKPFLDTLPALVYKDTLEPFKGHPKTIIFGGEAFGEDEPIKYYDDQGRELVPQFKDRPQPKKDFLRG